MIANKNLINKIKNLLCLILNVDIDELYDETTINDINSWDSLKHLQIIIQLESDFDININDQEAVKLVSLEEIILLVQNKLKDK